MQLSPAGVGGRGADVLGHVAVRILDWVLLLLVVVEHVSQDVLRVLQALCHLGVVAVQGLV